MGLFNFGKKEKKKISVKEEIVEVGSAGVKFRAIIEILGSPKDYVEKTMKAFVERVKEDHDYKIVSSKIEKPRKLKEKEASKFEEGKKNELYSTFAELEIITKKKEKIFDFCFNFMPSSIEIVEPMNLTFSANELSSYLTDIQATLHKVDFTLKQTNAVNQLLNTRNQNLTHNMVRMLRNNILLSLKEKEKDIKELVKNVGIEEDQLKPFIENMIKDNEIKSEKNKYKITK